MTEEKIILEELVRASSIMTKELDFRSLSRTLVEQTVDITGSDLGVLYLYSDPDQRSSDLFMSYKRGRYPVTQEMSSEEELEPADLAHLKYDHQHTIDGGLLNQFLKSKGTMSLEDCMAAVEIEDSK